MPTCQLLSHHRSYGTGALRLLSPPPTGLLAGWRAKGGAFQNPHVLIRPFVRREAVLSSRIEGTQATLGELLAAEAGALVERSPSDLREVGNYVTALEYGLERLSTLPLSLRMVRELHERLMRGVRGDVATPGEFRRSQNWIGPPGPTLNDATYVPPLPEEMMDCLGQWEGFLHDDVLPPLVHAALVHAQFEAIHPFLDGKRPGWAAAHYAAAGRARGHAFTAALPERLLRRDAGGVLRAAPWDHSKGGVGGVAGLFPSRCSDAGRRTPWNGYSVSTTCCWTGDSGLPTFNLDFQRGRLASLRRTPSGPSAAWRRGLRLPSRRPSEPSTGWKR